MTANPLPPIPPISATTGMAPPLGVGRFKPIDPLKVLRQHATLLAVAWVVGMVLAVGIWGVLRVYNPRYTSIAQLRVNPLPKSSADLMGTSGFSSEQARDAFMRTEAMRISSDEVLFQALGMPEVRQTAWFAQFNDDLNKARTRLQEDDFSVAPIRGSEVIQLSVTTATKDDPQRILNAIVQVYMRIIQQETLGKGSDTTNALVIARDRADEQIRQLRTRMENFTRQHELTALESRQTGAMLEHQRLTEQLLNQRFMLDQTREMLKGLEEAQAQGSAAPPSADMLQQVEAMPSVLNLTYIVNQNRQRVDSLTQQYGPNSRFTKAAQADLAASEAEKQAEVERRIAEARAAQLAEATKAVSSIEGTIAALEPKLREATAALTDLNAKLAEYRQLEYDLEQAKEARQLYEQRISEVGVLTESERTPISRSSSPTEAELTSPRALVVIPGVTLLVLGLTAGAIFLKELLDQRVKSPSDVKLLAETELLGVLPDASEDPSAPAGVERVVERYPTGLMAESYRQVRTAILSKIDRRGYKTLMVVGGQPRSGSSTVAHNLATSLAYNGRNVVIVDVNFRRPCQHKLVGIANEKGLIDVLQNRARLEEAVVGLDGVSVSVLPTGRAADAAPEILESASFRNVLAQLEANFDVVIVDAPPALLTSEAQLLAKHVDAMAIVVRANTDKRGMVERMLKRLDGHRGDVLGVVLNGVRSSAGGYFRKSYRDFYSYREGGNAQSADRGLAKAGANGNGAANGHNGNGAHRAAAAAHDDED